MSVCVVCLHRMEIVIDFSSEDGILENSETNMKHFHGFKGARLVEIKRVQLITGRTNQQSQEHVCYINQLITCKVVILLYIIISSVDNEVIVKYSNNTN